MLDNQGRPYAAPAFYKSPPPSMLPLPKFRWRSTPIISGKALSGPETSRLECQPFRLTSNVTSHDGKSAVSAIKERDESIDTVKGTIECKPLLQSYLQHRIQDTKTTVPISFTRSIAFEKLAQRMREATFPQMQHSSAQQHHQPTTILTRPKPRSILNPLSPPFTPQQSHQEPHPTNETPNLTSPPSSLQNQNTTKTPVPLASKGPEEVTQLKEEVKQLEEKENEKTEGHLLPHPPSPTTTTTTTTTTIPLFPMPPTNIHQEPGYSALGTAANDNDSGPPPPFCEICVQDQSLSTSDTNSDSERDSDSDSADDDQKYQKEERERIGHFSPCLKKLTMNLAKWLAKDKGRSVEEEEEEEEEEGAFTAGDRFVVKYYSQWGLRR